MLAPFTAGAQFSRDPYFNYMLRQAAGMKSIGDLALEAAQDAAKAAQIKGNFSQTIAAARDQFWAQYPKGPQLAAAKLEYNKLLFSKDLFYLQQFLPTGFPDNTMAAVTMLTGGEVDGGIQRGAQNSYLKWVEDVRGRMGLKRGDSMPLSSMQNLKASIDASTETYRHYVRAREMEEFRQRKLVPPGVDAGSWFAISTIANFRIDEGRGGEYGHMAFAAALLSDPYSEAIRVYDQSVETFGVQHVTDVSRRLMAIKGPIPAPAELGSWSDDNPFQGLMNNLGAGSPKNFLIGRLRQAFADTDEYNWDRAIDTYKQWSAGWGEKTVTEIATKLRAADKKLFVGSTGIKVPQLKNPAALGCDNENVRNCAWTLLRASGPINQEAIDKLYPPNPKPVTTEPSAPKRGERAPRMPAAAPATPATAQPAASERSAPIAAPNVGGAYEAGESIQVEWKGTWYKATVLERNGDSYKIHYDGYDNSWDEWVKPNRMRKK